MYECVPCWCVVSLEVDIVLTDFLLLQRIAPIVMQEMANHMVSTMKKIATIIHIMFVVILSSAWWKEDQKDVSKIKFLPFTPNVWDYKVINLITTLHQLCTLLYSKQIHYDL